MAWIHLTKKMANVSYFYHFLYNIFHNVFSFILYCILSNLSISL